MLRFGLKVRCLGPATEGKAVTGLTTSSRALLVGHSPSGVLRRSRLRREPPDRLCSRRSRPPPPLPVLPSERSRPPGPRGTPPALPKGGRVPTPIPTPPSALRPPPSTARHGRAPRPGPAPFAPALGRDPSAPSLGGLSALGPQPQNQEKQVTRVRRYRRSFLSSFPLKETEPEHPRHFSSGETRPAGDVDRSRRGRECGDGGLG